MAEILEIAKNGCLKTHIMYRANLSFAQLNEYLGVLLEVGLLGETSEDGKHVYNMTRKGISFLQNYHKLRKLLRRKGTH
jgi:predicted transcriptional regulator